MKNHPLTPPRFLVVAAVALSVAGSLGAQETGSPTPPPPQPPSAGYHEAVPRLVPGASVSKSNRKFLEAAARSGQKEAAVSEAVFPLLTTPAAKEFARMMVRDHTLANQELKALAAQKAVELPPEEAPLAKKWSEKTKDVDKDYLKEMVSDHEEAVALFEKATKADDPDIAAFAQKTLPVLRQHLEIARGNKSATPSAQP